MQFLALFSASPPPGYDWGMDDNDESPGIALFVVVAVLVFILIGDLVCAVGFLSGHPEIILALPGLGTGARTCPS